MNGLQQHSSVRPLQPSNATMIAAPTRVEIRLAPRRRSGTAERKPTRANKMSDTVIGHRATDGVRKTKTTNAHKDRSAVSAPAPRASPSRTCPRTHREDMLNGLAADWARTRFRRRDSWSVGQLYCQPDYGAERYDERLELPTRIAVR